MKRFTVLFVVLGVILTIALAIAVPNIVRAANDYVHLTDVVYAATLMDGQPNDKGRVHIKERLTFDIHAARKSYGMYELWRDLPEESDGGNVYYNVLSVKRVSVNGQADELEFTKASELYWEDDDYISSSPGYGPNKWFHSKGPYNGETRFECLMLYVDNLYRETTVFDIEYEMVYAARRYADCSELYLSMYSGKTIKYLNSFEGEIRIPSDKMPREGNYDAYTYGTSAHSFPFTESDTKHPGYHTFSFALDKAQLTFNPYNRYIEFALIAHGADMHSFTQYAAKLSYYSTDVYDEVVSGNAAYTALPQNYRTAKTVIAIVLAAFSAGLVLLIVRFDRRYRKRLGLLSPAQDFEFYREIPADLDAAFAGALALCKHKYSDEVPGGFAAAMLGLVKKRYIDLTRLNERRGWTEENIQITLNHRMFDANTGIKLLPALNLSEELVLGLIRRHTKIGALTMSVFQKSVAGDYEHTASFQASMNGIPRAVGLSRNYLRTANYKQPKRNVRTGIIWLYIGGAAMLLFNLIARLTRLDLAFGAFFLAGAAFIAAAILLGFLSRKYVLLTQFGENEYAKWRGLYTFLKSETLMKERTVPEVAIWEDYLIYATAFGISDKVLKVMQQQFPQYNRSASPILHHPYLMTRAFTRVYVHSLRHSVHRASTSHRMSNLGGGGFGGGYGGGGRGGGGGGGGH